MALKEVKVREFDRAAFALTSMDIGGSVSGYFVETMKSIHSNGGDNLLFIDKETGESFPVYSAGNIRTLLFGDDYKFGVFTVITRVADKMVQGRKSTQYKMQQDDEDTNPWLEGGAADTTIGLTDGATKSNTDSKQLS